MKWLAGKIRLGTQRTALDLSPFHGKIDFVTVLVAGNHVEFRADGFFQKFRHEVAHISGTRRAAFGWLLSAAHVVDGFERTVGAHVENLRRFGRIAHPGEFRPVELDLGPPYELLEIETRIDRAER